jgi:integral membrane protein
MLLLGDTVMTAREHELFKDALRTFRWVGYAEGISFLLLLSIAMPLKYAANIPEGVAVVGLIHGLLWVLYQVAAIRAAIACRWSLLTLFWAAVASILPFGPFVFDYWLRRRSQSIGPQPAEPQ